MSCSQITTHLLQFITMLVVNSYIFSVMESHFQQRYSYTKLEYTMN